MCVGVSVYVCAGKWGEAGQSPTLLGNRESGAELEKTSRGSRSLPLSIAAPTPNTVLSAGDGGIGPESGVTSFSGPSQS